MEEKELFLNVCEALETGGKNTKNAREKIKHGDAIKSMVEIVTRKWEWNVENLKEVMHMLAAPERTSKRNEEGSDEEYNTMSSSGDSATADDSESSSSEGDSDSESEGDNEELDDGENARDKSTNDVDEDNNSNNLNNDDVEVAKDINALDESKENETDDNDDDADE
jgi:ribonuclease E